MKKSETYSFKSKKGSCVRCRKEFSRVPSLVACMCMSCMDILAQKYERFCENCTLGLLKGEIIFCTPCRRGMNSE